MKYHIISIAQNPTFRYCKAIRHVITLQAGRVIHAPWRSADGWSAWRLRKETNQPTINKMSTVVIYGSSTGTCEAIANKIGEKLGAQVINVTDMDTSTIESNTSLIIGTSTWGAGELQDDWYDGIETLKGAQLAGKTVAVFGCGDSESYSDTFCGAMSELYNAAKEAGAKLVGEVSTDGYTFDDSAAVVDGKFVGLALDDVNEDDKTDGRIDAWIEQIKGSL